ncbi:hypothetical protein HUA76_05855 [Myxococcus sp. CA056]|uniref:DUF6891 domain-containing protein n=1 Tax=Myxococcus sp. CA056 TaxID=2741740 RepID=UPI00157A424E|nr:hypothetical protein [Myxococcus sp. CA056]NTX10302.1 hypothetical protein [Myxococcus sp. CA056]
MNEEELRARVRAISDEVMAGVANVNVATYPTSRTAFVGIDLIDERVGLVITRFLASTRGEVRFPLWARQRGLFERATELARRLGALDTGPNPADDVLELEALALGQELLEPAGQDAATEWLDDGHLAVGIETFDEEDWSFRFEVLATTRGDVPMPGRARRLGLESQAEALAKRLGALGFVPEVVLPEDEVALVPGVVEGVIRVFEYGHHPLDRVFDYTGSSDWDDVVDVRVQRRVMEQFLAFIRARAEEEKTWPEVIDSDRLEAAFQELRREGFVAEMSASTTMSGGWEVSRGVADERRAKGEKIRGTVFFHEQDTDSALEGHPLHLAYGLVNDVEDDDREGELSEEEDAKVSAQAEEVGRVIVETLRKHGFEPEWSGHAHSRIVLMPALTWRRRRVHVDTTETLRLGARQFAMSLLVEFLPRLRSLTLEMDGGMKLEDVRSDSVTELTLEYTREDDARDRLDGLVALVKPRFPSLQMLIVRSEEDFSETVDLHAGGAEE